MSTEETRESSIAALDIIAAAERGGADWREQFARFMMRRVRLWLWRHEAAASVVAFFLLGGSIITGASCGDNVVDNPTPVELCGQPPVMPRLLISFEFADDGTADRAALPLDDYELVRRYLDANVKWTWCIKEIR